MRTKLTGYSPFWPFVLSCFLFVILVTTFNRQSNQETEFKQRIAIVVVLTNDTNPLDYEVAIKSVECYSRVHNYTFLLVVDTDYPCPQKDVTDSIPELYQILFQKFFRRHCVVSHILPRFDTVLFIDADHGVVNPKRRIEEYMDPQFDLIFYDRFFDWEVMAGSYIAKNSEYTVKFLAEFADFENKLPKGAHGSDNGAIHIFLADKIFPGNVAVETCREVYYKAKNTYDVGAYVACIRGVFGFRTDFGNIRIMRKASGWSRDDWLTSGMWSPSRDFMLHGWKTKQMKQPPNETLEPIPMNYAQWYNPFAGPIVIGRCFPGNTSWSYNFKLLSDASRINAKLEKYSIEVEKDKMRSMARLGDILDRT